MTSNDSLKDLDFFDKKEIPGKDFFSLLHSQNFVVPHLKACPSKKISI